MLGMQLIKISFARPTDIVHKQICITGAFMG